MASVMLTGASRGIGRATALLLAERGVDVLLLGRPGPERDRTEREVTKRGVKAASVDCDLSRADRIEAAARQAMAALGPPDALINNAGVIHRASVVDTTLRDWDEQLAVNLRAPFLLTRAILPAMLEQRSGRIVHVASISSTLGTANAAAYCASKWGLVGFMKSLAEELTDTGVSTVAILPGSVDTAMLEGSGFEPRMSATDVARSIVYYALDAAPAHNGGVVEMFGT